MLKQYSAVEFKYAYTCSGRESFLSSTKSKTKLFSNKNRNFSLNRDPCVTILSVTVEMLHTHGL